MRCTLTGGFLLSLFIYIFFLIREGYMNSEEGENGI